MTLTEAAFYSRKMFPFVIVGFLMLLILYFTVQLLILISTPPEDPNKSKLVLDIKFQKIKIPTFTNASPSAEFSYMMDTIDGQPISATQAAKVVFLPKAPKDFGFLSRIYAMAKTVGFDTEASKHKTEGNDAIFTDGLRTLTIDTYNFNFKYQYTIAKDNTTFEQNVSSPTTIKTEAVKFLTAMDRYPAELAQGEANVIYFKYDVDKNELISLSEDNKDTANMVEVDFYRPSIDGIKFVSSKYFNSPHYVLLAITKDGYKVVRAQVKFFDKSAEQVGVYPLKTGAAAWKALQDGKGYVVSGSVPKGENVMIKKMEVAYYDPEEYQEYLQPVFVFLGEKNFVAYVPAVQDSYLTQ